MSNYQSCLYVKKALIPQLLQSFLKKIAKKFGGIK